MPVKNIEKFLQQQRQFEAGVAKALSKMKTKLFSKANVAGYGVGYKTIKKKTTGKIVAVIFVSKKVAPAHLKPKDRIPKFILVKNKRVPTDVQKLPKYSLLGNPVYHQKAYRPIKMGTSIEALPHDTTNYDTSATSGAVVTDPAVPDSRYMLSAGHVLNLVGYDVIQQGHNDGGENYIPPPPAAGPTDIKQRVGGVVKLAVGVDAGIAECSRMVTEIVGLGSPTGTEIAAMGMRVQKAGRTTGVTKGVIVGTYYTIKGPELGRMYAGHPQVITGDPTIPIPADATMDHLVRIRGVGGHFAMGGDSGSLVLAGDLQALKDWYNKINADEHLGVDQAKIDAFAAKVVNKAIGMVIIGADDVAAVELWHVKTALGIELVV
ncbi:MAG: hypothetical protein K0Q79_52 [Flavipsychrobacter sp.]|jgi:hypothetical protein|nr:hypothetical protein [Flavipsychrobacter sp.]